MITSKPKFYHDANLKFKPEYSDYENLEIAWGSVPYVLIPS